MVMVMSRWRSVPLTLRVQCRCVRPIDMRGVGFQTTKSLVHHANLGAQRFILLVQVACEVKLGSQAVDLFNISTLLISGASDVVDRYTQSVTEFCGSL